MVFFDTIALLVAAVFAAAGGVDNASVFAD